jgi:hypothetical protein
MLDSRPRTNAGCQRSVRAYAMAAESSSATPDATRMLTSPAFPCSVTVTVRMTRTARGTVIPAAATNFSSVMRSSSASLGGRNSLLSAVPVSANAMPEKSSEGGSASATGNSNREGSIKAAGSAIEDCSASTKVAVISDAVGALARRSWCPTGKANSAIAARCSATTATLTNPRLKSGLTPCRARSCRRSGGRHSSTSNVPRAVFTARILVHTFPQIKRENRQSTRRS